MELIYLLQFNNYYNRKATAPIGYDYFRQHRSSVVYFGRHNFVPGDGVDTELILNISDNLVCNYLVVANDEDTEIKSHWFVIESIRTRTGQYRLVLHRDLVADAYNDLLDAPMFIEKATLNYDDPFIFNDEQMTFNQIKSLEFPMKDSTQKKWIVGYIARNQEIQVNEAFNASTDINSSTLTHTDWLNNHPVINVLKSTTMQVKIGTEVNYQTNYDIEFNSSRILKKTYTTVSTNKIDTLTSEDLIKLRDLDFTPFFNFNFINSKIRTLEGYVSDDAYRDLDQKTILFSDGVYKINVSSTLYDTNYKEVTNDTGDLAVNLQQYMSNAANSIGVTIYNSARAFKYKNDYYRVVITLTYISDASEENIQFNILENRQHLQDAPYDLFFMEHNEINLQIAQLIMLKGESGVFDVQLVPYCPSISIYNAVHDPSDNDYIQVKKGNNVISAIYFSNKSTDTVEINQLAIILDPSEYKLDNLTKTYRIVSPNFNGMFEFSASKNHGVNKFFADFTYKPYQPYIHVYPQFDGLYGGNFKDARGLICGGDFSLPRVNDAFNAYEVQNKYYQQIFDRNIQTMELQNKFAQLGDITGAFSGTLQGAASGALMGGVYGAVAGGVASAVGGAMDVSISRKLRNDALDLTKDQFGYTLGNIRALPQSISKTTAFTANNKYWPILEVYTCYKQERDALINKLKWNGMTVMRIGTINEFLQDEESYIKGKLIRLESNNFDNHYTVSLANELNQGIYIKREVYEDDTIGN